ncbi:hypothetical protein [Micromonospora sp. NPDC047187]|uniref:hypothetical protein n=1 Tax=Micromonospora sp. NPDC047187 TaxID=3155262 RepID=UPI0033DACB21
MNGFNRMESLLMHAARNRQRLHLAIHFSRADNGVHLPLALYGALAGRTSQDWFLSIYWSA